MKRSRAGAMEGSWVAKARCCTEWYVLLPYPIRKCGICGEVPTLEAKNDNWFVRLRSIWKGYRR